MRIRPWEIVLCVLLGAGHWLFGSHAPVELRNPDLIVANIAGDILAVSILYFLGKFLWITVRRRFPQK